MRKKKVPATITIFAVKGGGKTTASTTIRTRWPAMFEYAFAEPLKQCVHLVYPKIPKEHIWGDTSLREIECKDYPISGHCMTCGAQCVENMIEGRWWKCVRCSLTFPKYLTPRLALQSLGTEWGRRLYVPTWTEAGLAMAAKNAPTVIADGRFFTERAACEASGACLIYLTRGLSKSTDPHPSEAEPREMGRQLGKGLYHFDIVIDNENMSLEVAQRTLIEEIEALAERQISRINWVDEPEGMVIRG